MNESLEKELTIITPEQVQLKFRTAGVGSRAIAHLWDGLILLVVNGLLLALIIFASRLEWLNILDGVADYAGAALIILFILLNVGYFLATEMYMGGQTPGKKIMGLRVLQDNGQSATFLSIIIRNLFRILDFLPSFYFLGALIMLFSSKDKRIGDMVAGTIVVTEPGRERLQRKKGIDKSVAAWEGRLPDLNLDDAARRRVTPEDWQLIAAWMERLSGMSAARREEFSQPIFRHFVVKLQHESEGLYDASAYLIALYLALREDWEI
ncbi:RDD family protein [Paenibacillus eucommiae]|uniref:RDD family membrane protein YckC n=1 Tax=Paenibacillus eucommiae TaxID=1355755 RepID=A0ABS4IVN3_9BACL|nr:RDD family protein [Paenibacillus eucommiae]MBP1990896.1 putative RDD family membrane protein YckC [Paenibacillus eucommiae]